MAYSITKTQNYGKTEEGGGMVRQRGKGGKYHYEFMVHGKRFIGVCEGCSNKREAEAYEKRMRDRQAAFAEQLSVDRLMERRRQEITGREPIRLADAFEAAMAKPRRRNVGEKARAQKKSIWADFVAYMAAKHPNIADLAAVTQNHCEGYIAHIRSFGRFQKIYSYERDGHTVTTSAVSGAPSATTARVFQRSIAEVFRLLKTDAGIEQLPTDNIPLPPKAEGEREAFTIDEIKTIVAALPNDEIVKPIFFTAILSGLRRGDVATLRWCEVDFADGVIRRRMLKTGVTVEIPLLPPLANYLGARAHDGEYVFPTLQRMYSENPSGISIRAKKFLLSLGFVTTYTPAGRGRAISCRDIHSLRHSFATIAAAAGIPLPTVQAVLGHTTTSMTMRYAQHASTADKRRAFEKMPELIAADEVSAPPAAMLEKDAERAALLREIETLPTEVLRDMLAKYRELEEKKKSDTVDLSVSGTAPDSEQV